MGGFGAVGPGGRPEASPWRCPAPPRRQGAVWGGRQGHGRRRERAEGRRPGAGPGRSGPQVGSGGRARGPGPLLLLLRDPRGWRQHGGAERGPAAASPGVGKGDVAGGEGVGLFSAFQPQISSPKALRLAAGLAGGCLGGSWSGWEMGRRKGELPPGWAKAAGFRGFGKIPTPASPSPAGFLRGSPWGGWARSCFLPQSSPLPSNTLSHPGSPGFPVRVLPSQSKHN